MRNVEFHRKLIHSVDHKILKQKWCQLLGRKDLPKDHYKIYKSLVDFDYVELHAVLKEFNFKHPNELLQKDVYSFIQSGEEFRRRIKSKGLIKSNPFRHNITKKKIGIPQGTPISAFLANLYLLDYDLEILNFLNGIGNCTYRRYSDDILVICETANEQIVEKEFLSTIEKYQLEIQKSKTQKTKFINGKLCKGEKPVKYLGFEFDGRYKRLKSSSLSKYYRNLKKLIRVKASRASKMKKKHWERGFIYRKEIYKAYSHHGAVKGSNRKRNYLSYVNLAVEVMNDKAIKKQLSKSWKIIHEEIERQTGRYKLHNNQNSFNCFLTAEILGEEITLGYK